jgi:hypothetical protein
MDLRGRETSEHGWVEMYELGPDGCHDCTAPASPGGHRQVHLTSDRWAACVDAGIAALVAECWLAGIPTQFSCEEARRDRAQLVVPTVAGFERLIGLLATAVTDMRLRSRAIGETRSVDWDGDVPTVLAAPRSTQTWATTLMLPLERIAGAEVSAVAPDMTATRVNVEIPTGDVVPAVAALAAHRGGQPLPSPITDAAAALRSVVGADITVHPLRRDLLVVALPDAASFEHYRRTATDAGLSLFTTTATAPTGTTAYIGPHTHVFMVARSREEVYVDAAGDPTVRAWLALVDLAHLDAYLAALGT